MNNKKTTLEEKKRIVKHVIMNNNDYKGASLKYDVSYANVYNWVKKYNRNVDMGLLDNRGRPRKNDLLEERRLKTELNKANRKIAKLDRENFALKKNKKSRVEVMINFLRLNNQKYIS